MLVSRHLQYFLAVARHLHFGRAADELDVAPSALSRHIKLLEHTLGVRLMNRGRRSAVNLTAAGEALVRETTPGLEQLERAIVASRQIARGEIGRLSIGYVISASLTGVLPLALERFRAGHSQVAIEVSAMDTPSQLSALHDGRLDVGFLRPRRTYPAGVTAQVVHREDMLLALAANHPLASKRFELRHLASETFIIPQFDENSGFAEHLAQLTAAGGFAPSRTLHVKDFLTAMTLAAAGYGVVPVPRCMLGITLRNLEFRAIHGFRGSAELAVAYKIRKASAALQAFIGELTRPNPSTRGAVRIQAAPGDRE